MLLVLLGTVMSGCEKKIRPGNPRVLVFTKTAGYRHSSIDTGVAAIIKLGKNNYGTYYQESGQAKLKYHQAFVQIIFSCNGKTAV